MSNQLAVQEPSVAVTVRGVQLSSYAEMKEFARDVANSGLAPRDLKTPEAILVALQYGMEVGLSPAQALQSVAVINGRPVVWGDAALAIVKAHPECVDVIETIAKDGDDLTAYCKVLRRDKEPVVRHFSVAMAKQAGLWKKAGPWTTYPARMLAMRARAFALRDSFPDALKGVAVREEVRDIEPKMVKAREVPAGIVFPDETGKPAQTEDASQEEPIEDLGATSEAGTKLNEKGEFVW